PKKPTPRRIMIAGGGNIGYRLAKQLEHAYNVKIIECRPRRAEWIAENLDNTLVLQGSATDETLLDNEYIDEIDVFCALTNDDESNIMSALLAKNLGAKRVIGIVNRSSYVDLLEGNKIDIVVSPHLITIGSILAHIRRGDIVAVHPIRRGTAEAIEVVAHGDKKTSAIIGRRISGIKWPEGCHIAAVVRAETGETIMGHHTETVIQDGDHIIFFVSRRRILNELEKLIQVKMGFFG
ncbi:Trk system potassium transporter TrkA, partial [Neisseria meningitidis]